MTVATKQLGPFEIGQAPLITNTIRDTTGSGAVATATNWRVVDPTGAVTEYNNGDPEITEVADNIWTLQLPPLEHDGIYWVRCDSEGLVSAHEQRLGVVESAFDTED